MSEQISRKEIIAAVAEKNEGISKAKIESIVTEVFETIKAEVAAGKTVGIHGFGSFHKTERKARNGVNPRTGEKINIPAKTTVSFGLAKAFKDKVNG